MGTEHSSEHPAHNGAGDAALTFGVVAAVFVFVPVLGVVIAAPAALVALFCGLVGLARAEEGTAANKGAALAGVFLGLMALLGVVVTLAATVGPLR